MWNIAIQPAVGCYNSWANLQCSGCYPLGENYCETGLSPWALFPLYTVSVVLVTHITDNVYCVFMTLRPRQNDRHIANVILKYISWKTSFLISLKWVPKCPICIQSSKADGKTSYWLMDRIDEDPVVILPLCLNHRVCFLWSYRLAKPLIPPSDNRCLLQHDLTGRSVWSNIVSHINRIRYLYYSCRGVSPLRHIWVNKLLEYI